MNIPVCIWHCVNRGTAVTSNRRVTDRSVSIFIIILTRNPLQNLAPRHRPFQWDTGDNTERLNGKAARWLL